MGTWAVSGVGAHMLLLLLLCCFGGECEPQESKPVEPIELPSVKPFPDQINEPQAFPEEERANLPVFTMDYPRIQVPFEFTLWILLASFAKIGTTHNEPRCLCTMF